MNVDSVNNLPSWHFFGVREIIIKKEGKGGRKRGKEEREKGRREEEGERANGRLDIAKSK